MTGADYKEALFAIGLSQEGAASPLGIGKRTSQAYALDELPVPKAVAIVLRALVAGKLKLEDLN